MARMAELRPTYVTELLDSRPKSPSRALSQNHTSASSVLSRKYTVALLNFGTILGLGV
jgi:hypothetical protein